MNKDKLNKKLSDLEKNYGLVKAKKISAEEKLLTRQYGLDYVLDGGVQLRRGGHKIELYGAESSGKTTFALKMVKAMQDEGKKGVWVVSESFNSEWAEQLGVNTEELLLAYPDSVEDAGELILSLIPEVDFIVLDSVASLIPKAEIDRAMDEPTRGTQAKAYSYFCRKLYPTIAHEKTTLIFINQVRVDMNKRYGDPETTPCGKALRHMYDTRINFKPGAPIEQGTKDKKERIGQEIRLYGKKNKVGVPQRKIAVDFYFDGRVDNRKSLLFAGIKFCIIGFSGKTYTYKKKKAVGKDNFIKKLSDEDWKTIEEEVWERLK